MSIIKILAEKLDLRGIDNDFVILSGFERKLLPIVGDLVGKALNSRIKILKISDLKEFRYWLQENNGLDDIRFKVGEYYDLNRVTKDLVDLGYNSVKRVRNPREFSILGDLLLVWAIGWNNIIRMSFWDNELEEISLVDSLRKSKIRSLDKVSFIEQKGKQETEYEVYNEVSDNISTISFIFIEDLKMITDEDWTNFFDFTNQDIDLGLLKLNINSIPGIEYLIGKNKEINSIVRDYYQQGAKVYLSSILSKKDLNFIDVPYDILSGSEGTRSSGFVFSKAYYKDLNGNRSILIQPEIENKTQSQLSSSIFTGNGDQDRLVEEDITVYQGEKILYLTDYEISGEIFINNGSEFTKNFKKVRLGDYIVHEDHGIGIYDGLKEIKDNFYLIVRYLGEDKLYVPIDKLSKITKYFGDKKPKVSKLRGRGWNRVKKSVRKSAKLIAKELMQLYTLRNRVDSPKMLSSRKAREDLKDFIEDFEYEETDDQIITTEEIIEDLESSKPMDRLLIGDVGFGKTEMAARAIFATVNSGFQVAFLAPTTILAEQHKEVLSQRFSNFNCNIESLSRLKTKKEKEEILWLLEEGELDVLVGTHALLSDAVKFYNLGLIVIDEEQKFGVKHKEKLKAYRVDSNVLTMTATPIPRSLQMSISKFKDISIIMTPPSGRKAVKNKFGRFNWNLVEKAISKELKRGGQVYYLHNRIRDIEKIALKIENIFPNKEVRVAHGSLSRIELSSVMRDLATGKIDVLVCTTIIENGLDIENVNSLIVDEVESLGLSQMYQIRGRIGRGVKQAYAYFLYSKLAGDSSLRLKALKEFSELGSGYLLAHRDLEIRGAGNIFGKEQSGDIERVGYDLYNKMLEEEIDKLGAEVKSGLWLR